MEVSSFKTLQNNTRIPNKFKKQIRLSKKTSFIYSNKKSFRVISKNSDHYNFIKKSKSLYSSSANITNKSFDYNYAYKNSDIIVYNKNNEFMQNVSSAIFKISNYKIKKIR